MAHDGDVSLPMTVYVLKTKSEDIRNKYKEICYTSAQHWFVVSVAGCMKQIKPKENSHERWRTKWWLHNIRRQRHLLPSCLPSRKKTFKTNNPFRFYSCRPDERYWGRGEDVIVALETKLLPNFSFFFFN